MVNETRKLVTIRKVAQILPIDGADNIELAKVDGWQVVVKKGDFKQNSFGVFFEVDSFLPQEPRYEFLRKGCFIKNWDGKEGFRLRTIKLRKQLSQGLLLPLSEFPEISFQTINPDDNVGIDLTTLLNVTKYEKAQDHFTPVALQPQTKVQKIWYFLKPYVPSFVLKKIYGRWPNFLERKKIKGFWPSFLQKTDQERIQNIPEVLMQHWDDEFEITQKLDGSSMTAYLKNKHFGVCSRNLDLMEVEGNQFWQEAREQKLEEVLRGLKRNLAFQGELCGPNIQDNYEKLEQRQFFLFDIYDIDNQRYLTHKERSKLATGRLGLDVYVVPGFCENIKTLHQFVNENGFSDEMISQRVAEAVKSIVKDEVLSIEDLDKIQYYTTRSVRLECFLSCANGKSALDQTVQREGLVFKSSEPIDDGRVLSFKAINNEYLLKEK